MFKKNMSFLPHHFNEHDLDDQIMGNPKKNNIMLCTI